MGATFSSTDDRLLNNVTHLQETSEPSNIATEEATITYIYKKGDNIKIDTYPIIYSSSSFSNAKDIILLKTHPNFDELFKELTTGNTYKFTYKYSSFGDNILTSISESTKFECIGIVKGFVNVPINFRWLDWYEIIIGSDCTKRILVKRNKISGIKLEETYKFICDRAFDSKYYKVVDYKKIDI